MPLLSTDYLSQYQVYYDDIGYDGINYVLLEKHTTKQSQAVTQELLIQGNYGTQVMDVPGVSWQTDLSSPVIIFNESYRQNGLPRNPGIPQFRTSLDYAMQAYSDNYFSIINNNNHGFHVYDPNLGLNIYPTVVMKEATINIGENGVTCDTSIASDYQTEHWLHPVDGTPNNNNWFGRVAKWYDIKLGMFIGFNTYNCLGMSGIIKITVDITNHHFINSKIDFTNTNKQSPDFAIKGYKISGNLKVAFPVALYEELEYLVQQQNTLGLHGTMMYLDIANSYYFDLSVNSSTGLPVPVILTNLTKTISGKEIITAELQFVSYATK